MPARRAHPPPVVLKQRQLTDNPAPLTPPPDRPPLRRSAAAASWWPVAAVGTDSETAYRSNVSAFPRQLKSRTRARTGPPGRRGGSASASRVRVTSPGGNVDPALVPPDLSRRDRRTDPVRSSGTSRRPLLTGLARTVDYGNY
ncbi:hypothetical protein ACFYO5_34225 [Streptomyces sp. NPDC006259]|uniref:hypothetical protein n=1 Tax=Streptomyces sp. NPDC006259 TaxID=3364740 RepID=UPI0036AFF326